MSVMNPKMGFVAALSLVLMACSGCSDVNSKVAGPGGGPSSGASGSTSREGGYLSGTNSEYSENVNAGTTAPSPGSSAASPR